MRRRRYVAWTVVMLLAGTCFVERLDVNLVNRQIVPDRLAALVFEPPHKGRYES